MNFYSKHVFICTNQKATGKKCCADSGGSEFFDYMKEKLLDLDMHGPGKVRMTKSGCLGRCGSGPCIVIYPDNVWYTYTSFEDIDEIIKHYFVEGKVVERLLIPTPAHDI